jgi:hypothetical protein
MPEANEKGHRKSVTTDGVPAVWNQVSPDYKSECYQFCQLAFIYKVFYKE